MNILKRVRLDRAGWLIAAMSLAAGPATAGDIGLKQVDGPAVRGERVPAAIKKLQAPIALVRGGGVCGDSSPDPGEECDDGNTTGGDGCSASCLIEAGSDCTLAIASMSSANVFGDGSFELLDGSWTGDSIYDLLDDTPAEGNNNVRFLFSSGGDLNSFFEQDIVVPSGATSITFEYVGLSGAPPACGNARMIVTLTDDTSTPVELFNTDTDADCAGGAYSTVTLDVTSFADGTTSRTFRVEHEYILNPTPSNFLVDDFRLDVAIDPPTDPVPSTCFVGVCGDGIVSTGEQCDDGNTDADDGCDASCGVEEATHACGVGDTGQDVLAGALSTAEYVDDGGMEDGLGGPWTETGTFFAPICSEVFCGSNNGRSGAFYAWFGGITFDPSMEGPNVQTLSQTLTIGVDATTLEFYVGTQCSSDMDTLAVDIDGDPALLTIACSASSVLGPTRYEADISAYADGLEHVLTFTGMGFCSTAATDPSCQSNFFLDDISILASVSPDREPVPSNCVELPELCATAERGPGAILFEQFEAGIPLGWTNFDNAGTLPSGATWTTTDDTDYSDGAGCGGTEANWPGGNVIGSSGEAACADADGSVEALVPDADMNGSPDCNATDPAANCQMRAYLCTPPLPNPVTVTGGTLSFDVNYQTAFQDGTTPPAPQEEILELLGDDTAPIAFTIGAYESAGQIFDHLSSSLSVSGSGTLLLNLNAFADPNIAENPVTGEDLYVCFHYGGVFSWYAQIDNVGFRADNCLVGDADFDGISDDLDNCPMQADVSADDADGDGVLDDIDNCSCVENPDQADANGDLIGNLCDPDVTGPDDIEDCSVNFLDLNAFKAGFFGFDPELNLDGMGNVSFADLNIVKDFFFGPPGPSAAGCN